MHPFINRKNGREPITYLHPLLEPALSKTLGVPLFQEQLMQIAIDVAGFTPAEADQLRRAMGSKRSLERMEALHQRLLDGMAQRGIGADIGEQIFDKLKAFADFGFPESHAFSFAYLVYASSWLKVHHPEAFYAGLLAAQPMGFYSPASLVADAARHGVRVERADVTISEVQACVQRMPGTDDDALAVRLGLAPVRGIGEKTAERLVAARERAPFADVADLSRRVGLSAAQLEALATAGALAGFRHQRREALWLAGALAGESGQRHAGFVQEPLPFTAAGLDVPELPAMDEVTRAVADVWATRTLDRHLSHPVPPSGPGGRRRPDHRAGAGSGAGHQGAGRRRRHASATPGHRTRCDLPVAGGRDRSAQRHLLGRRVGSTPQDRPGQRSLDHPRHRRARRWRHQPDGGADRTTQPAGAEPVPGLPVTAAARCSSTPTVVSQDRQASVTLRP